MRRRSNAQRPTSNARWPKSKSSLRPSRRCRFVNRTNHCTDDDHFDQSADTSIEDQLSRNRLPCVKAQTHPDPCDFQQHTKPDSRNYAAPGETGGVDHYERKNNECLANDDPVKQTHHFTLGPPEIWRFRVNIFEEHAVKQPPPQE